MALLEREAQLADLREALDSAANGSGRCVLLRGDAGTGKTALVDAFADECGRSARVLRGYCDHMTTPMPLGPVWDLARTDPTLRDALERDARSEVFERVVDLLGRGRQPSVIVLEDLHWADEATLDLVGFLGRRIQSIRGLLVVTCRETATPTGRQLRRIIGMLPRETVQRVDVGPLSGDAIATLLAGAPPEFDVPGGVEQLAELTGGNPLFVVEVLADPHSAGDAVPRSVRELVQGRVLDMPESVRDLVALIAMVPGAMSMSEFGACGGDLEALAEAEEHGIIVVENDLVGFRHEITRLAVEQSLPRARCRRLHERVLDAFVRTGADPSRIVHQAVRGGDADAIVTYAPLAAQRAAEVDSHREAADLYRLLDGREGELAPDRRTAVLLDWARAELTVGDATAGVQRATQAVEAARDLGDDAATGRALLQLGYAQWFGAEPGSAEASIAAAVTVLSGFAAHRTLARAIAEQAALAVDAGRYREADEMATTAQSMAQEVGDRGVLAHALATRGRTAAETGYPLGTDLFMESTRVARDAGFVHHELRAILIHAETALAHRDLGVAAATVDQGLELAVDRNRESLELDLHALAADLHLLRGRYDLAEVELGHELQSERISSRPVDHKLLSARLRSLTGGGAAESMIDQAWASATATGELSRRCRVASVALEHAHMRGEHCAVLDEAADLLGAVVELGHPWLAGDLALRLSESGRPTEMPSIAAEPFQLAAAGDWSAAASAWEALGMPYERAVALLDGDEDAAVAAIAILDELGARPMADRARTELRRRTGRRVPRPRQPASAGRGGLTQRQFDVLELLASHLSNAEIADRLFLSVRTVEHHVAAVMERLGATSRDEAVAIARARSLLELSG